MPTSTQLANAIVPALQVDDLSLLTAKDASHLLHIINAALDEFWRTVPNQRKISVESYTFRSPVQCRVQIVEGARGFAFVDPFPLGGYQSPNELIGKTIIIDGDGHPNRLQDPDLLLYPYLGTTGEKSATIYADSAGFGQDDLQIAINPTWRSANEENRVLIYLSEEERAERCKIAEFDKPVYYWTEPLLSPRRNEYPLWLLRIWPIPTVLGAVQCDVAQQMPALHLDSLQMPRELPILDRELGHVVNICIEALLGSPLALPNLEEKAIRINAERSRLVLAQRQTTRTDAEQRRIGTPLGW